MFVNKTLKTFIYEMVATNQNFYEQILRCSKITIVPKPNYISFTKCYSFVTSRLYYKIRIYFFEKTKESDIWNKMNVHLIK